MICLRHLVRSPAVANLNFFSQEISVFRHTANILYAQEVWPVLYVDLLQYENLLDFLDTRQIVYLIVCSGANIDLENPFRDSSKIFDKVSLNFKNETMKVQTKKDFKKSYMMTK